MTPASYDTWRERLRARNVQKLAEAEQTLSNNSSPIHPLRLCKEVRDILDRDAILCVDGQETLNYARQAIPQYTARHRINSGAYGTMGVGMPFGLGAKAACPDKQVVVLHGDGSWGMNAMEFDTVMRHKLPVLVVISQNGGWTGDPDKNDPVKSKPGRELGYPRYDKFAECFGGHGEYVEKPEDIAPALERQESRCIGQVGHRLRRHGLAGTCHDHGLHPLRHLTRRLPIPLQHHRGAYGPSFLRVIQPPSETAPRALANTCATGRPTTLIAGSLRPLTEPAWSRTQCRAQGVSCCAANSPQRPCFPGNGKPLSGSKKAI
ncbi:MAG: thiamine pyrophosphate-dependent enzyme [Hyphomicrobiaceae bacterium]